MVPAKFLADFFNHLRKRKFGPAPEGGVVQQLYEIAAEYHRDLADADELRNTFPTDWERRRNLVTKVGEAISQVEAQVEALRRESEDVTNFLALGLKPHIEAMKAEVSKAQRYQNLQKDIAGQLAEHSNPAEAFFFAVEHYLLQELPRIPKTKLSILMVAAAIAAGGIFTKEEIEDEINPLERRIPMRRLRAQKAYQGVEVVAPRRPPKKS